MSKPKSDNRIRIEQWDVQDPAKAFASSRKIVTKVAVRDSAGRFHGATNFIGSVIG